MRLRTLPDAHTYMTPAHDAATHASCTCGHFASSFLGRRASRHFSSVGRHSSPRLHSHHSAADSRLFLDCCTSRTLIGDLLRTPGLPPTAFCITRLCCDICPPRSFRRTVRLLEQHLRTTLVEPGTVQLLDCMRCRSCAPTTAWILVADLGSLCFLLTSHWRCTV